MIVAETYFEIALYKRATGSLACEALAFIANCRVAICYLEI